MYKKIIMIAGSVLLSTAVAFAAAPTTSTSTAQAPSKILDKISLGYTGLFFGPAVENMNMFQPNSDGTPYKKVNMENYLSVGYKVTPKTTVSVVQGVTSYLTGGADYSFKDPVVKVGNATVIEKGTFTAGGDVRAYIPATAMKKDGVTTALRVSEALSYDVPNTKFNVSLGMFQRYWFLTEKTPKTMWMDLELDFNPSVAYQVNDRLAVEMGVDKEYVHWGYDKDGVLNLSSLDLASLSVGLNWKATKKISFAPALSMYPEAFRLDATSIGFTLIASIL